MKPVGAVESNVPIACQVDEGRPGIVDDAVAGGRLADHCAGGGGLVRGLGSMHSCLPFLRYD